MIYHPLITLSFHVNLPSHSWDTAILKIDPGNPRSRSWVKSKFQVTMWVYHHEHPIDSHPFGSMSNGPPIPEIQHFQSLTLKIQGQSHSSRSQSRDNTLSTLIIFVPCQSPVTFLGYNYFKICHWKFKVKVISEVKVESHNVGPTFSRLTTISFHVNRASHSWVATFSKFVLENQGPRSCVWSHFEVTMWV